MLERGARGEGETDKKWTRKLFCVRRSQREQLYYDFIRGSPKGLHSQGKWWKKEWTGGEVLLCREKRATRKNQEINKRENKKFLIQIFQWKTNLRRQRKFTARGSGEQAEKVEFQTIFFLTSHLQFKPFPWIKHIQSRSKISFFIAHRICRCCKNWWKSF